MPGDTENCVRLLSGKDIEQALTHLHALLLCLPSDLFGKATPMAGQKRTLLEVEDNEDCNPDCDSSEGESEDEDKLTGFLKDDVETDDKD